MLRTVHLRSAFEQIAEQSVHPGPDQSDDTQQTEQQPPPVVANPDKSRRQLNKAPDKPFDDPIEDCKSHGSQRSQNKNPENVQEVITYNQLTLIPLAIEAF